MWDTGEFVGVKFDDSLHRGWARVMDMPGCGLVMEDEGLTE